MDTIEISYYITLYYGNKSTFLIKVSKHFVSFERNNSLSLILKS